MHRHRLRAALVGVAIALTGDALAADTWLQVKSDHFTVMTNAGERKARSVAWQFEQVRAAIGKGWPWAQAAAVAKDALVYAKNDQDRNAVQTFLDALPKKRTP